ncbi:unnamed protein product [Mortierella alpina]
MSFISSEPASLTHPPLRLEVHTDPGWLTDLRACSFATDPVLVARADSAFTAPGPLVSHEDTHGALKVLLNYGLVATTVSKPLPTPPSLAQEIVAHVLNGPSSNGNMTATITRGSLTSTFVVPRRLFMLRELAFALSVDIYVFSARTKARLFNSATPTAGTVAIFHAVDSFLGTSEYLVLVPAVHPPPPRAPSLTPGPPPQAAAQLRTTTRHGQWIRKPEDLSAAKCEEFILIGLMRSMKADITKYVRRVLSKGPEETRIQRLENAYAITLDRLKKLSRLPRGSMKIAAKEANKAYGGGFNITEIALYRRLESGRAIQLWRQMLESKFDQVWEAVAENAFGDGVDEDDGSSSESDDEDEHEDDDEDTSKRTCTASLHQILHPDLVNHFNTVLSALETTQLELTTMMEETALIARKTVHMVASGSLYFNHGDPSVPRSFNIRQLLPTGFEIRDDTISLTVAVAPIPDFLEKTLLQRGCDVADLLSQGYLQFAQARILQPTSSARTQKGDQVHPTWKRAIDRMTTRHPVPDRTTGSAAVNTATRQLAVAIKNHWDGPNYGKALDKLLRILLRIHLAPQREKAFYYRRKAFAIKKKQEAAQPNNKRLSGTSTKWKVAKLFNDLADAMTSNNDKRQQALLAQLLKLQLSHGDGAEGHDDADDADEQDDVANLTTSEASKHVPDATVEDELDRLLEFDLDADMDEIDNLFDEDESLEPTSLQISEKEPSRAHLRRLETVLKTFWNLPSKSYPSTEPMCTPRPFGGPNSPTDNVTSSPCWSICWHPTGYHHFSVSLSPEISSSSCQALNLGGSALYETMCSRDHGVFDILSEEGNPITNARDVNTLSGKRADCIPGPIDDTDHWGRDPSWPQTSRASFDQHLSRTKKKGSKSAVSLGVNWAEQCAELGLTESELDTRCKTLAEEVDGLDKTVKALRRQHAAREVAQTAASHELSRLQRCTAAESDAYARLRQARIDTRAVRALLMPREAQLRSMRQDLYSLSKLHSAAKTAKRPKLRAPKEKTKVNWDNYRQEDATEMLDISQLVETQGPRGQIVFAGTDYGVCKMSETVAQTWQEMENHIDRYYAIHGSESTTISCESDFISPSESDEEQFAQYDDDANKWLTALPTIMDHDQECPDQTEVMDLEHEGEDEWSDVSNADTDESWTRMMDARQFATEEPRVHAKVDRASLLQSIRIPKSHKITAEQLNDITYSQRNGRKRERRLKRSSAVREALYQLSQPENILQRVNTAAELEGARSKH